MREGLDRHDAIHAIGCVLASHINNLLRQSAEPPDSPTLWQQAAPTD